MVISLLWIIGFALGANLVLTVIGFIPFALLLNRSNFRDPIAARDAGLQPLTALPGVAIAVPQSYWPVLEGAHSSLRKRLGNVGSVLGILSVATSYFVLFLPPEAGYPTGAYSRFRLTATPRLVLRVYRQISALRVRFQLSLCSFSIAALRLSRLSRR